MNLKLLLNPRVLYVASIGVAILSVLSIILIYFFKQSALENPINVIKGSLTDNSTSRFPYNKALKTITPVIIEERGNYYFLPTNTNFKFEKDNQGSIFLVGADKVIYAKLNSSGTNFNVSNQILNIANVEVGYTPLESKVIVIKGNVDKPIVVNENQAIEYSENKFVAKPLDRTIFYNKADWQEIVTLLKEDNSLPSTLADIVPPVLNILKPTASTSELQQLVIQGITDANATLTVNDQTVTLKQGGNFEYTYSLQPGLNTIIITTSDGLNTSTKTLSITYSDAVITTPVILNSDNCSIGELENQLFCLVNQYRKINNLPILKFDSNYGLIARQNAYAAVNASKPQSEIPVSLRTIKVSDITSVTKLYDRLKTTNQNDILGSYTSIAIGIYKTEAVIVLF